MIAVPLVNQSRKFSDRVAVIDHLGRHTYASIRRSALHLHTFLLPEGEADLHQSRVAFLVPPDFRYVVSQWAIWLAGGVTVPLCPQHPVAEWEYALGAVRVSQVIVSGEFIEQMSPVADQMGIRIICLDELKLGRDGDIADGNIGESDLSRNANILFTSGTTNRPKGVVTTHGNLQAQIETLVKAWDWRSTAILWQKRCMQIDGSEFWQRPNRFRQHPESHNHLQVGLNFLELELKIRIL